MAFKSNISIAMMQACICLIGAIALTAPHAADAAPEDPQPTIIINGWQNADYAEQSCIVAKRWIEANSELINLTGCNVVPGCQRVMPIYSGCVTAAGATAEVRSFEDVLVARFVAEPKCKGISFLTYYGPHAPPGTSAEVDAAMRSRHWDLFIGYILGSSSQRWLLEYGMGTGRNLALKPISIRGEGTAERIASDVCTIVAERSGKVR